MIGHATYDSVAFRFISVNTHPDCDTIATFRKRFLDQLHTTTLCVDPDTCQSNRKHLSRRQDRIIAIAKEKIEQRGTERYVLEQQEYDKKVDKRKAKAEKTGKKPSGVKTSA